MQILCTLKFVAQRIRSSRVVIYALRAKQAHTPSEDNSTGLTRYWQTTYAMGYLTVFHDTTSIMRSLLVRTTLASTPADAAPSLLLDGQISYGSPEEEDQPRIRRLYRRICFGLTLNSWIPVILGTVAGINYPEAETSPETANMVYTLRYASTMS